MENKEIIEQIDKGESWEYMNTEIVTRIGNLPAALELARQDEREKMQGVDCWVSWDATDDSDKGNWENPVMSIKEPAKNTAKSGRIYYTGLGQNITISKEYALKLGLQQGQCKKFRIVEELP